MTKRAATPKLRSASIISTAKSRHVPEPKRDRLRGGLRAFLVPGLIAEFGFYGVRHRLQDGERPGLALFADEAARPCFDRSVGVWRLRFGKAGKVGNLVRRIDEREGFGARVEAVDRRGGPSG